MVSAPAGSSNRRNEQISSFGEPYPFELRLHEYRDHVVRRMLAAVLDDRAEVVEECVRRARRALELEAGADHLDRAPVEHRKVCARQAEQARDHDDGEAEGDFANEVGLLVGAVDERVDVLVDDVAHELAFPRVHRLAAERLLHEAAVEMVLGLVHLEDRVAEDLAHDVGVALRRERLAVLQHLLHGVEAERGEHADAAVDRHEFDRRRRRG